MTAKLKRGGDVEFSFRRGLHIRPHGLWLDPTHVQAEAIVSHAHTDHLRRHATASATAATADLAGERYPRGMRVTAHRFGAPFVRNGASVTLYPAGHVLGSAQVLVDDGKRRLLYTGDLRLRPSAAAEPVEAPHADVLILDATFGRRRYVFPPEPEVVADVLAFCERSLELGLRPVLLAYALGKAQEMIVHLQRAGYPVAVHASVQRINAIYRRHGVSLAGCLDLEAPLPRRAVVVAPPQARNGPALHALGPLRTAMLSGWAMDPGARYRYHVDAAFPLSDHCGFDDLLRYVELVGVREVYTVFGDAAELQAELRLRGIVAFAANGTAQLALPGLV